jgi:hypothetical protein
LKPYSGNARLHSDRQIRGIAASIREFGFIGAVLVDKDGVIVAGHARVIAAKAAGLHKVPTLLVDHLSPAQKRAFIIAENRLAELAEWDQGQLKIEFQELIELDFEVELTGFETAKIDVMLDPDVGVPAAPDPELAPEVDRSKPAVSQLGDLWLLGEHRLLCADATEPDAYASLMGPEKAQMVFTDPPYNVPIDGHVCGKGRIRHREFAMASGEMTAEQFTDFLLAVSTLMVRYSVPGSIHYICMDHRHAYELLDAGRRAYERPAGATRHVVSPSAPRMGTTNGVPHGAIARFRNAATLPLR